MSMDSSDQHVDGNALAGLLQEILVPEFTTLRRTCQSCGDQSAAGAHRGYRSAGVVLRCPSCGDIAVRVAELPGRQVFELRGTWTRFE
jgi:predicted RNA-binding Zn-ribbon protein involved in translation (DUF1610 family)